MGGKGEIGLHMSGVYVQTRKVMSMEVSSKEIVLAALVEDLLVLSN
jgi:hypothetical protein